MLPFSPYVLIDVRRQMSARHSVFVFGASRLPCTPTSGLVWYRFGADTSRQVDEVLTVIHSLVINHGCNKIMFVYSLDDWRKRSGVVSGNDFY